MSIRLMMVDDHPVVRAGLRALLEADAEVEVVADVGSGDEALQALDRLVTNGEGVPDLVLMDLNLGDGIGGIETTRRLRAQHPGVQVLAVTTFDAEADVVGALEAGATGYLLKDALPDELMSAVRAAARGESVLAPSVTRHLMGKVRGSAGSVLTDREREVLQLVANGASNREAAAQLFIGEASIKTHLQHIYDKLGVRDRASAVGRRVRWRDVWPAGPVRRPQGCCGAGQ